MADAVQRLDELLDETTMTKAIDGAAPAYGWEPRRSRSRASLTVHGPAGWESLIAAISAFVIFTFIPFQPW